MWNQIENLIQLSQQELPNEVDLAKNPERRNYYRFFYHLLLWRKPKIALEIGVEQGLCSTYMALAAQQYDGMVIGLDINGFPHKPSKNYYFIQGDSCQMDVWNKVLKMTQEFGPIGVVYQDSSHHYEASIREWELYSQLLDKDSIWVCDDIMECFHDPKIDPPNCSMVTYFNALPHQKRTYSNVLHRGNTQGVIWIP